METKILIGDCIEQMRTLPDGSVHCCITSPPYFGLRDYNVDGQIGLESTPDEYVQKMVEVFREVRRVLRCDGVCFVNLGDSYVSNASSQVPQTKDHKGSGFSGPNRSGKTGLKPKDLIGIPWRVAFAIQADGWYLRQDIIWAKPNPMPESVTDRCTKAHEYVFLLSKSARYYYDAEAIKEGNANPRRANYAPGKEAYAIGNVHDGSGRTRRNDGFQAYAEGKACDGRNKRSVWTIPTTPFKGAHFATFPPKLIEPMVLAGCPKGGTILDPFGGSGTTAYVANGYSRKAILCELNPEYEPLIRERLGMPYEVKHEEPQHEQLELFNA